MSAVLDAEPTLTDLAVRLGSMPLHRLRLHPFPATEEDVIRLRDREHRLFELVDGVLVEKAMGFREGYVAAMIIAILQHFVGPRKLGVVNGADGMMRLAPGLVRIPDVSFCKWEQFPNHKVPPTPIPDIHPDLAVEVLSQSNTDDEMDDKLEDYFNNGSSLVWLVDPKTRSALVFTSPDRETATKLVEGQRLDGGTLLPGLTIPLADIFAELDPQSPSEPSP
ncbi:MAG: Uma2 family endonuclease [Gemmataceae bacterium]